MVSFQFLKRRKGATYFDLGEHNTRKIILVLLADHICPLFYINTIIITIFHNCIFIVISINSSFFSRRILTKKHFNINLCIDLLSISGGKRLLSRHSLIMSLNTECALLCHICICISTYILFYIYIIRGYF